MSLLLLVAETTMLLSTEILFTMSIKGNIIILLYEILWCIERIRSSEYLQRTLLCNWLNHDHWKMDKNFKIFWLTCQCVRLFLSSLASTFFALLFLTGTWAKIPVMRTTFWVELYSYADKQYSQTPITLRIPEFSSLVYSDDRNSSVYSDNFDNN